MTYKEWHDTLYKAGYTESIVHKDNQRHLTLEELEAAGQFFWDGVFATSTRERISIEMAMIQLSLNRRIPMELTPKPMLPSLAHPVLIPSGNRAVRMPRLLNPVYLKTTEKS